MSFMERSINEIREKIAAAANRSGKSGEDIELVAVSKTAGPEQVREAFSLGLRRFGENRVQELARKREMLADIDITWDCIGQLQKNKVKYTVGNVDLIQSVDRLDLAAQIQRVAERLNVVQGVLMEINIGEEASKGGIEPDMAEEFANQIADYPNIELRGIMCIPPFMPQEEARPYFRRMKELYLRISDSPAGDKLRWLSMGMSGDYETAIEEGSNMVRIGTAIFGQRIYTG
ncbi:MAG: YggS family pyridoxal phosphate-dependent enzyme [Christensenellales bacterium]|jgi:pyridoxal phosphate enzyme (YggS family)